MQKKLELVSDERFQPNSGKSHIMLTILTTDDVLQINDNGSLLSNEKRVSYYKQQ